MGALSAYSPAGTDRNLGEVSALLARELGASPLAELVLRRTEAKAALVSALGL